MTLGVSRETTAGRGCQLDGNGEFKSPGNAGFGWDFWMLLLMMMMMMMVMMMMMMMMTIDPTFCFGICTSEAKLCQVHPVFVETGCFFFHRFARIMICLSEFQIIPSRKLTYPPDKAYLKMIFLFPRLDMLVSSLEGIPNLAQKKPFWCHPKESCS